LIIYCGSPFAAAEVAAKPLLATLNGPLGDAVEVLSVNIPLLLVSTIF
jgi:hypothetical protein